MPHLQVVKTTRSEAAWLGAGLLGAVLLRASVQPCPTGAFVEDDDASPGFVAECEEAVRTIMYAVAPWQRSLLIDTRYRARRRPSRAELEEVGEDQILLGLYTAPPATITVYEESIIQTGQSAFDVISHELRHRWGYDHKQFEMRQACRATKQGQVMRHGNRRHR